MPILISAARGGLTDLLDATFSGHGCMLSADDFMRGQLESIAEKIAFAASLRHAAAMSGAMRYPWSQEFAIDIRTIIRGR